MDVSKLIGRTILSVEQLQSYTNGDKGHLEMKFTDGSQVIISATFQNNLFDIKGNEPFISDISIEPLTREELDLEPFTLDL